MPNGHRAAPTRTVGSLFNGIEVSAHYEHTITLTVKLTGDEAAAIREATEGIQSFLLQSKEPLNPNAQCFTGLQPQIDNGLAVWLDFTGKLIDSLTDDEDDEREEITIDDFVERWEEEGPKKRTSKKRKRG